MKKKSQKEKSEKMKIEAVNVSKTQRSNNSNNNKEKEQEKSQKKLANKSKSTTKSIKKFEEIKTAELQIEKKPNIFTYNLDFIYRRERYILKRLYTNYLLSCVKKLISKKISVDINLIQIYYLDKELTDDKINVYDLIKDNKIKYFEIKKESPINENIISLNANVNLIYKVKCKGIENAKDFIDKIDIFFREKCLDKHYLCEPVGINEYDVGFSCEDNCYQFKRYMTIVRRLDTKYTNTTYEYVPIDKKRMIRPKLKDFITINRSKESLFINKGPYMTYEELKKKEEKEGKKKWVNKKGFLFKKVEYI
jgi:hypothetical protein